LEFLSPEFLSALLSIVIIDLVLAGDNAIVIALAARNVPPHLQKRAIMWGTVGAIAVRTSMTVIVVWLLKVPGLLFVGGALLVWIAYKLLLPEDAETGDGHSPQANTFWSAMRTIIVADALMGLDNVLAVAGAAHGSYLLVVLGLLISVPIVVWGSSIMLHWVERVPAFVYLGAGVLAWTAVKMTVSEPMLKDFFSEYDFVVSLLYMVVVTGVLWLGFVKNHRRLESRITARLAQFADRQLDARKNSDAPEGESNMKVLVPVDGTRNSEFAVRHVVRQRRNNPNIEIHLLNVQRPFSRHVSTFLNKKSRDSFHLEEADKMLGPARKVLDGMSIPYTVHVEVREKAQAIVDTAQALRCHHIVMGTARKNSITRMVEDSVTAKVLELTTVPVEVVVGEEISSIERLGIPAAIATALAILLLASD